MPGLAGIIHSKDKNYLLRYAAKMSESLVRNSSDLSDEKALNGAAFCHIRFEHDSDNFAFSADRSVMLLYFGKVYDDDTLRQRLLRKGDAGAGNCEQAELFLKSYRQLGREALCGLNGIYVVVIWDSLKKKLIIINDRYGLRKLYYRRAGDKLVFATEIKAICLDSDFSKTVDEIGISNLLVFGHLFDDRTLFKDVKLLPQASVLTYSDSRLVIEKYWDYSFYNDDEPVWLEEHYVDGLAEVIERAVRKRVKGINKIALPLSGGLDSRVIAGMLKKIGFPGEIITYSYGHKNSYDVRYGRQIAQKLHYPHYFVPINEDYIKNYAEEFIGLNDGMIDCLNAHMGVSKNFIKKMGNFNVATGFLGDIQTGIFIFSKKIVGLKETEDIINTLFKVYGEILTEDELKTYLREDVYRLIAGLNYDAFRTTHFKAPTQNKFYTSRYGSLVQRQRRYTSFNIYCNEDNAEVLAPFVDNEVSDFGLHMPPALAIEQNIYKKMIIKYLPEVAGVPCNVTTRPLKESWLKAGFRWRKERFLRNQLPKLTFGKVGYKLNDSYMRPNEAILKGSRSFVKDKIGSSEFLKEYFIHDRIKHLLNNHIEGKVNGSLKICVFLTLALWAEQYLSNETKKEYRMKG